MMGLYRKLTLLFAGGAAAYWVLIILVRKPMWSFLYANNYADMLDLLPWVAVDSVLMVASRGPVIALRAMQSPASVFVAYCASSVIALAVGIPITRAYGLRGAILAMILSGVAALIACFILVHRKIHSVSRGQTRNPVE